MTLGELIKKLSKYDKNKTIRIKSDVFIDIYLTDKIGSYRGYYDQLALGYGIDTYATVGQVLKACKAAVGETFTGYKGGEYEMGVDTNVWISNYGHASDIKIVNITEDGYGVWIEVFRDEY